MGGLALLRNRHRGEFGILMFHSFSQQTQANIEAICAHLTRHFEPVSLTQIVESLESGKALPKYAIAVTVDDGYRNFLQYAHPIFRRHRIPAVLYAVAGFSEGRLWLWPDRIDFGIRYSKHDAIHVHLVNGRALDLPLITDNDKNAAVVCLTEALLEVPDAARVAFLESFGGLCGVEIPVEPPPGKEPMSWGDLRAVASEGVEIGCHTETHPILSRLSGKVELEREILGAKLHLEERLGFPVRHFCYPNGKPADIDSAAMEIVRRSGYASAVTCSWGFNSADVNRLEIRRLPLDSTLDLRYGKEVMAGLHL